MLIQLNLILPIKGIPTTYRHFTLPSAIITYSFASQLQVGLQLASSSVFLDLFVVVATKWQMRKSWKGKEKGTRTGWVKSQGRYMCSRLYPSPPWIDTNTSISPGFQLVLYNYTYLTKTSTYTFNVIPLLSHNILVAHTLKIMWDKITGIFRSVVKSKRRLFFEWDFLVVVYVVFPPPSETSTSVKITAHSSLPATHSQQ